MDGLLAVPRAMFGRSITQAERDAWLPEAQTAADMLVAVANDSPHDLVRLRVRLLLQQHCKRRFWRNLVPHLETAFAQLRPPDDLEVYLALLPAWEVHGHGTGDDELRRRDGELQDSATKQLGAMHSTPEAIVAHVGLCAEALRCAGWGPQPERLLRKLAEGEPAGIALAVIASGNQALQHSIVAPMAKWLQSDPDQAFRAIQAALDSGQEALCLGIANGYWHNWFYSSGQYPERHMEVLERLVRSSAAAVRRLALEALRNAPPSHAGPAVAMIVGADYADDGALLDAALGVFDRQNGLDPALLTDADVRALLEKAAAVQTLSRGAYHIDQFLGFACKAAPGAVVECLLSRIARSASGDAPEGYEPLPHTGFYAGLNALSASTEYANLLRQVRDAVLRPEWQYHVCVPELYALVSESFSEASLGVLGEWVESGEPEKIVGAARLLDDAEHEFVFDRHAFVAEVLTHANQAGQEPYDRARSRLFGVAIGGIVEGTPGKAPPRYVEDQERAERLAAEYAGIPAVSSFYAALAGWVKQEIARGLAEDEELLE
jgi:hypothetical protein